MIPRVSVVLIAAALAGNVVLLGILVTLRVMTGEGLVARRRNSA